MINSQCFIWKKEGANIRARSFPSSRAKAKANSLNVGTGHLQWLSQHKSKGYTVCRSQYRDKGTEGSVCPHGLLRASGPSLFHSCDTSILSLSSTHGKGAPGSTPCGVLMHDVLTAVTELGTYNKYKMFLLCPPMTFKLSTKNFKTGHSVVARIYDPNSQKAKARRLKVQG